MTAKASSAEHWTATGKLHKASEELGAIIDALTEVRDAALLTVMHTEPSNIALETDAGLGWSRIQKMRRGWRSAGQLPPLPEETRRAG